MKVNLVGFSSYDFVDEKSGDKVQGGKLHYVTGVKNEKQQNGAVTGQINVRYGSELYRRSASADFTKGSITGEIVSELVGRGQIRITDVVF